MTLRMWLFLIFCGGGVWFLIKRYGEDRFYAWLFFLAVIGAVLGWLGLAHLPMELRLN